MFTSKMEKDESVEFVPVEIEEVDLDGLGDDELSEFIKAETIRLDSSHKLTQRDETELIKRFLEGQISFSAYNQIIQGDKVDTSDEEEELNKPSTSGAGVVKQEGEAKPSKAGGLDKKPKRSVLPSALQGLMGEANLRCVRGDLKVAEKICLEIIRQMPLAVEPFHTLAQIYEGRNLEKQMQFMLIAGHLNPGDHEHWLRLAELSLETGNTKQAIICYSRAIKANPRDFDLRLRRIELIDSIGDERFALTCRLNLLPHISESDPEMLMSTAKYVAEKYHKEKNIIKATSAFKIAHNRMPQAFSTDELNQYLDLLLEVQDYHTALSALKLHSGVSAVIKPDPGNPFSINIPDDLIPDFRTKFIVCIIHSKAFHLIDLVAENVFRHMNVERDGDCYLDIAEALIFEERFEDALRFLEPLLDSQKFSLAAVWLRHADCLRSIGHFDLAIESYKKVVSLAPQHLDARLTLSALLKQSNKHQEALKALEQDLESDLLDPTLLYERCYMLKETGNIDQYIDLSMVLFSRHCIKFRDREELETAVPLTKLKTKWSAVKELRETRLENIDDQDGPEFTKETDEPDIGTEWILFKDVVEQCFLLKRYEAMQKITVSAISSRRFYPYSKEIRYQSLTSSMYNRDSSLAYTLIKEILQKTPQNRRAWNVLSAILQKFPDTRYYKSLHRMVGNRMDHLDVDMRMLNGNYCLISGSYNLSLKEYFAVFKKNPQNAFSALLIAVTLGQMSCQKYANEKSDYINQALSFLAQYQSLREPEALYEVYYNFGRLYQLIGLIPMAIDYYNKVLQFRNAFTDSEPHIMGLKQETAFNLHLIYKSSGNVEMARKMLYEYIVV